jgi:hypothetical protein
VSFLAAARASWCHPPLILVGRGFPRCPLGGASLSSASMMAPSEVRRELRRTLLPKLFGKSEWVPNRGYESGQDGSKESRSTDSWRQGCALGWRLPRTRVNIEGASCFSRACLAQRSCPSRDRLCSSLELSPDRPMALPTAPAVIAPAAPQITPITTPRATSPVHHHTPRLTTNDTTKNTTVDNITMAAILVRILHPIVCVRCSVMRPTLFALQSGHSEITALQRCRRSSTTLGRRPRAVCSPAPLAGWSR